MEEVVIRGHRGVYLLVLGVGALGLALAASELFRGPWALLVFSVATLLGLVGALDRRVKLSLSEAGIRYARWGPAVVPWHEFSGYRRVFWRGSPYLELVPRRPIELVAGFSWLGRLNHRSAGLVRMPRFALQVTSLAASESALVEALGRYLPEAGPG